MNYRPVLSYCRVLCTNGKCPPVRDLSLPVHAAHCLSHLSICCCWSFLVNHIKPPLDISLTISIRGQGMSYQWPSLRDVMHKYPPSTKHCIQIHSYRICKLFITHKYLYIFIQIHSYRICKFFITHIYLYIFIQMHFPNFLLHF